MQLSHYVHRLLTVLLLSATIVLAATAATSDVTPEATTAEAQQITLGDGAANWIVTKGAFRDGATFTFPEVHIDGNGWLVMHGFKDGRPVGDTYVGATYVIDGDNRDVKVTVNPMPAKGEMYIVMLHRDVNENKTLDFEFVDAVNVLDKAVFEGSKMIAHRFAAP